MFAEKQASSVCVCRVFRNRFTLVQIPAVDVGSCRA